MDFANFLYSNSFCNEFNFYHFVHLYARASVDLRKIEQIAIGNFSGWILNQRLWNCRVLRADAYSGLWLAVENIFLRILCSPVANPPTCMDQSNCSSSFDCLFSDGSRNGFRMGGIIFVGIADGNNLALLSSALIRLNMTFKFINYNIIQCKHLIQFRLQLPNQYRLSNFPFPEALYCVEVIFVSIFLKIFYSFV